jgi:hypothetical protein
MKAQPKMRTAETALKMVRRHWPEVDKIEEATKPLRVTVTKDDCKNAVPSFTDCPVAKALQRERHQEAIVEATRTYVRVSASKVVRYINPVRTRQQIAIFDVYRDGDKFGQGDFMLSPVRDSYKLGPRRHKEKRTGRHMPTGKREKPVRLEGVRSIRGEE